MTNWKPRQLHTSRDLPRHYKQTWRTALWTGILFNPLFAFFFSTIKNKRRKKKKKVNVGPSMARKEKGTGIWPSTSDRNYNQGYPAFCELLLLYDKDAISRLKLQGSYMGDYLCDFVTKISILVTFSCDFLTCHIASSRVATHAIFISRWQRNKIWKNRITCTSKKLLVYLRLKGFFYCWSVCEMMTKSCIWSCGQIISIFATLLLDNTLRLVLTL